MMACAGQLPDIVHIDVYDYKSQAINLRSLDYRLSGTDLCLLVMI